MKNDLQTQSPRPPRKPIWPWLALLVFTLLAIYSYHRVSALAEEIMSDMPHSIIELFNDLLRAAPRHEDGLRV